MELHATAHLPPKCMILLQQIDESSKILENLFFLALIYNSHVNMNHNFSNLKYSSHLILLLLSVRPSHFTAANTYKKLF